MSGGLGVPLSIATYFVQNYWAKLALALTAIACFVFASYRIWRSERIRVMALDELLIAKLTLSLGSKQGHDEGPEIKELRRLISVTVENSSAVAVTNCQILLVNCLISMPFDLRPGEDRKIIIFYIKEDEKDGISSASVEVLSYFQDVTQWNRHQTILSLDEGDYIIKVLSDNSVPGVLNIRLSKDIYWSVEVIPP